MERVKRRFSQLTSEGSNNANNQDTAGAEPTTAEAKTKGHIVIPYTQGLCKSIKKICSKYGIQTHFRGNRTIKNILVPTKDKDPMENKSGAIHWYQCGELVCDEEYIRETSMTFGERFKEHLKEPSPMHHHRRTTGHITTQDNFQIIGRLEHGIARTIKESIYIRVNNSTLNRNTGKFNLHHIWDRVLLNTPVLKINWYSQGTPPMGMLSAPNLTPINWHAQGTPPLGKLSAPNLTPPCTYSQAPWNMLREHLCLNMQLEPPRTYIRCWILILPQNRWSPAVGWMKASLNSTKVLFQTIYNLYDVLYLLLLHNLNQILISQGIYWKCEHSYCFYHSYDRKTVGTEVSQFALICCTSFTCQ